MSSVDPPSRQLGSRLGVRLALAGFILLAIGVIWITNLWLTERFTESTRNRAEVRLALYRGNLKSELRRASVVPLLLSRDPALIGALASGDHSQTSQRLIEYGKEIEAASLILLDGDGRVVAATDRSRLGEHKRADPYFVNALRAADTVFTAYRLESGATDFTYSRKITSNGALLGVIVVYVDLVRFETAWAGIPDAVMVTDSSGNIILATEPRWRGRTEAEALAVRSAPSAIRRAIQASVDWGVVPPDAWLRGEAVMREELRVDFQGWRITSFTTYASVREKVNSVLAIEIMAFAILLALAFYLRSRKALSRSMLFQRESAELRELNDALQREISERQRAERHLEVAEQTIAQSSKLAALGEMSASVSHELNQPLAAMKTYLAGARLLLQRRRPEEALSSFQRIDDLIERMGAITRQLKSYARKGGTAVERIDFREAVSAALSLMEPQLRSRDVRIVRSLPREPVRVMADRLRLEQVIVNLLRNAFDATRGVAGAEVRLTLTAGGGGATLAVRDNGHGIEDLENLFEPFYTTKPAGDGVGLGLAISSGIVADFDGRLTARNGRDGGAVFELYLPLAERAVATAAE
jgi:two-component system C4-dicarboxylate transport sensor histidine kinase DctB